MSETARKYAATHEWVALEGEVATIGISDFAVELLSDLVYVDLPAVGSHVTQGETFGEVESVKAVSDLYAPLSGEVLEVNVTLKENQEPLSSDPFGAGWIVKIRPDETSQLDALMDEATYRKHCEAESQ